MSSPKLCRRTGCLKWLVNTVLGMVLASPWTARACAVCYGEPDSPAARGLTWAIVALGVIVVTVLGGAVSFFVHASHRSASLDPAPTARNVISDS